MSLEAEKCIFLKSSLQARLSFGTSLSGRREQELVVTSDSIKVNKIVVVKISQTCIHKRKFWLEMLDDKINCYPGLFFPAWLLRWVQLHLALGGGSWHQAGRLGGWLPRPGQPGGGGQLGAPPRGWGPDRQPEDGECDDLLDPACLLAWLPDGSLQAGGLQQWKQVPGVLSGCPPCWGWGEKIFWSQHHLFFNQIEMGLQAGLLYSGEVIKFFILHHTNIFYSDKNINMFRCWATLGWLMPLSLSLAQSTSSWSGHAGDNLDQRLCFVFCEKDLIWYDLKVWDARRGGRLGSNI